MSLFWIPATIAAAVFQVGRNALQRGVMASAGPWGATLVRFLFGLPFSLGFVLVAILLVPDAGPRFGLPFWLSAGGGAASQVLATAALLSSMQRSGFAVGTALQQSSLPLAALLGLAVFDDRLSPLAWAGVAVSSLGLAALFWPVRPVTPGPPRSAAVPPAAAPPPPTRVPHPASGAAYGLLSGLLFGFSLDAFRHATLILDPHHPVFAAILSLAVVQAAQAACLTTILAACAPATLLAVLRGWRASLGAGLCGSLASAGWFVALSLSPAAPVRALGVIETPIAALAGHRLFRETLRPSQILAGLAVAAGIVMTAIPRTAIP